ncbi:acetyltransferase [Arcticibacter sp. MXS-1]|uniref:acetyltransferase n=1 Tax=Arcticibacter sp. MXS-1 TaxID=3341726 RepID=UPI0035A94100
MNRKKLALIGGGGHCRSCIDVLEQSGLYSIEAIVDAENKLGEKVLSYEISAADKDIPNLLKDGCSFLITLGQVKTAARRRELYLYLKQLGAVLPLIISPRAYLSPYASAGEGSVLMHNSVMNAGSTLAANSIVNTGAVIDHDSHVGSHVHISTNAVINGGCLIEDGCFIGSNAVVNHNISIARNVVIGSGTVVNKSIRDAGVYAGSPARRIS